MYQFIKLLIFLFFFLSCDQTLESTYDNLYLKIGDSVTGELLNKLENGHRIIFLKSFEKGVMHSSSGYLTVVKYHVNRNKIIDSIAYSILNTRDGSFSNNDFAILYDSIYIECFSKIPGFDSKLLEPDEQIRRIKWNDINVEIRNDSVPATMMTVTLNYLN